MFLLWGGRFIISDWPLSRPDPYQFGILNSIGSPLLTWAGRLEYSRVGGACLLWLPRVLEWRKIGKLEFWAGRWVQCSFIFPRIIRRRLIGLNWQLWFETWRRVWENRKERGEEASNIRFEKHWSSSKHYNQYLLLYCTPHYYCYSWETSKGSLTFWTNQIFLNYKSWNGDQIQDRKR